MWDKGKHRYNCTRFHLEKIYIWFGKHIYISGASTGISGQEYIEDQRNGIYWLQYMALQGCFMREKGSGRESIAAVAKFDKMQK